MKPEMKPSCSRALVRPTMQVKENSANTGPKKTMEHIKSHRRLAADVGLWRFTVIQRVHFGLVLHDEEKEKKNEAQDDHSHSQDGKRSVGKWREVTRGNSQFISKDFRLYI